MPLLTVCIQICTKAQISVCTTWDDLQGSVLFRRVIESQPHRQNRTTSDAPVPAGEREKHRRSREGQPRLPPLLQEVRSPHVLMPGYVWQRFLCLAALGSDRWVLADEARVQQEDVWAQDGLDHL